MPALKQSDIAQDIGNQNALLATRASCLNAKSAGQSGGNPVTAYSRAQGCRYPGGRAVEFAAMGKLTVLAVPVCVQEFAYAL